MCECVLRNWESNKQLVAWMPAFFQGIRQLSEEKQTAFVWIPVFSHFKQIRVHWQREIRAGPSSKGVSMKTCCYWSCLWHFSEITVITVPFCCNDFWSDCKNYREQDIPRELRQLERKKNIHNPIYWTLITCVCFCVKGVDKTKRFLLTTWAVTRILFWCIIQKKCWITPWNVHIDNKNMFVCI